MIGRFQKNKEIITKQQNHVDNTHTQCRGLCKISTINIDCDRKIETSEMKSVLYGSFSVDTSTQGIN